MDAERFYHELLSERLVTEADAEHDLGSALAREDGHGRPTRHDLPPVTDE